MKAAIAYRVCLALLLAALPIALLPVPASPIRAARRCGAARP